MKTVITVAAHRACGHNRSPLSPCLYFTDSCTNFDPSMIGSALLYRRSNRLYTRKELKETLHQAEIEFRADWRGSAKLMNIEAGDSFI